jgi:hypothetical protein
MEGERGREILRDSKGSGVVTLTLQRHVDISHIPTARSCDQLPNLIGGPSSLLCDRRVLENCVGKEDKREKEKLRQLRPQK